jgi:hypothetical protein
VLSIDDKPSIRHGTVNLFAALQFATGVIGGKTTQTKKRADFQAFMDEVVADQPADWQIHVILDNLNAHKKNEDWLAAHPKIPTSDFSSCPQVEMWFGIVHRKKLKQ